MATIPPTFAAASTTTDGLFLNQLYTAGIKKIELRGDGLSCCWYPDFVSARLIALPAMPPAPKTAIRSVEEINVTAEAAILKDNSSRYIHPLQRAIYIHKNSA